MARTTAPITSADRLAGYIFDGPPADSAAVEVAGWLAGSPRFRAFAEQHRDKIRKKLRGAADVESRRDVRAELAVAHRLMADKRIALAFEAYGSTRRGPDFTVAHRGELEFNLEVTRLRGAPTAAPFVGSLLLKLRQLPPSMPNALLVAVDGPDAAGFDIAVEIRSLRAHADAKQEALFTARRLTGSRDFYDRFLRLGAVIVWAEGAPRAARTQVWVNRSSRIAVPSRAMRTVSACLSGG